MPPVRTVLVSGAGIAGPTLAFWLLERGFTPTLVEQAAELRRGGYIVDFWGRGYDVAERMGLLPEIRRQGHDVEEVRFVGPDGRRAGGFRADVIRGMTEDRFVSLRRSDISRLVYAKIESRCETIFGDGIDALSPSGDGVSVQFEHGPARRFDLVIGADGLHSAVRRLAFGPQSRFERYLGYVVAAFEVEGYRPRDERVFVSYTVPGKQVSRFAMRDDRTLFLLLYAEPNPPSYDFRDLSAHKAILCRVFADVGWECPQILMTLDAAGDLYFDRVSQIRMEHWSRGRVALIGDAAFCPSLLAGQGSSLAMMAAYVLAGELAKSPQRPEEAFSRYDALLHPFIAAKQKAAERFAPSFVPSSPFGLFLRNQVTKLFRVRAIANLAIGGSITDRIALPDYPRVH